MEENPYMVILDRLRERGWRKFDFGSVDGTTCIRGAAIHSGVNQWEVSWYLTPILKSEYPERVRKPSQEFVAQFNDHRDTDFEDVERVLEKAAVKWEEERVVRDG